MRICPCLYGLGLCNGRQGFRALVSLPVHNKAAVGVTRKKKCWQPKTSLILIQIYLAF